MKKSFSLIVTLFFIICVSCTKSTKGNSIIQNTINVDIAEENLSEKEIANLFLLKDDSSMGMRGLYFLYQVQPFTEKDAIELVKKIRLKYSFRCNITIIDDKSILSKVDDFNLSGSDYCYVADHFICMSSFDCPEEAWYYPYQDELYKEYGGVNWKVKF